MLILHIIIYMKCNSQYFILVMALSLFFTNNSKAQSVEDSLRKVLAQKSLSIDKRTDAMDRLGQTLFFNKGWNEGIQMFLQSLAISATLKDGQYRAHTYGCMAMSYYIMSDGVASKKCLDSALYYVKRTQSNRMKGFVYYSKGWLEARSHQEAAAIKSFQQALDLYEKEPDKLLRQEPIYSELAGVYLHWYDMVNVEKYTRLSLSASNKLGLLDKLISANQGRGAYFINLYRSDSTQGKALDSALYYMRRSLNMAQANSSKLITPSDIPFSAINISNIFLAYFPRTEQYQDSIDYYNKIALEEGKRTQQFAVESGVYMAMGNMAFETKDYDKAIQYINLALVTSAKDLLADKFNTSESYLGLAVAYEGKGDMPKALSNYKEHLRLYKELFSTEKMNSAKRLEVQYEIAKKEKALLELQYLAELKDKDLLKARLEARQKDQALLAAEYAATLKDKALLQSKYQNGLKDQALTTAHYKTAQREQELKALQQTADYNNKLKKIYALAALACFLVAILLFYAYHQRSKTLAQKQKLHTLELEKVKQEHRISMLSAMLDGQEQERTRLARDLHDGLGGLLSGVKIGLSGLTPLITDPPQQTIIGNTLNHLDSAVDELRRIAKSMMPEVLLLYGLGEATKDYCANLNKAGLPVNCQVYNYKNDMPHSRQVTLYRIMQELVNNAVKHAKAKQILVQLQQSDNRLFLTIEDDGEGFDKATMNDLKGAGLSNIQARVEMLKGKMGVETSAENGTTVTIECLTNVERGIAI